jgi:uncharacterized membrane protein HdeD (DUF308 family)
MPTCPKCHAEAKESDKFCSNCGASLTIEARKPAETKTRIRERDTCFGERERDYLGLVSFGFLLLTLGIIFTLNPNTVDNLRLWIEQISTVRRLVRPPEGLIFSVALFFGLIGVFDFAMAGIRLAANDIKRRVLADSLSGIALVLFAYLIQLYGGYNLPWPKVLGIEAIACGLLIAVYSVARYSFKRG